MMAASWRLQSVRQQRTTWWATIFYGSIHAFSVCHGFWPQAARHTHFLMNHSGRKSIKIFSDRNTIQLWKASHTSFYILSVYTATRKRSFELKSFFSVRNFCEILLFWKIWIMGHYIWPSVGPKGTGSEPEVGQDWDERNLKCIHSR